MAGMPGSFGLGVDVPPYGPNGYASMMGPPKSSQDLSGMLTPMGSAFQTLPVQGGPPPGMIPPTGGGPPRPPFMLPPLPLGPQFQTRPPVEPMPMGSMPPGGPPFMSWPPPGGGMPPSIPPLMPQSLGPPPMSGNKLGKDLTVHIFRLLDMPIEQTLLGGTKRYRIRIYDKDRRELKRTEEIEGMSGTRAQRQDVENIELQPETGVLEVSTSSELLYLDVEHVGGMLTRQVIGTCQIHRLDPRSVQPWPYRLNDDDEEPINCGIELKVTERSPPFMMEPSPSMMLQGPPLTGLDHVGPEMHDLSHGVSADLVFEKVTDMPYPSDKKMYKVMLTVQRGKQSGRTYDDEKPLRRIGPFIVGNQGEPEEGNMLVMADCLNSQVNIQAPLDFGGDAAEGAMYLKVGVSYVQDAAKMNAGDAELIGVTDAIKVSFRRVVRRYYEILQKETGAVLGGVYLTHRLVTEDVARPDGNSMIGNSIPPLPQPSPVEMPHIIRGRTGNFPPGSPQEAYEQAMINCEAQNRALLQRCKIADPQSHIEPHVQTVNGYREWDNLDSLFATMGPNPLTMSEEVGPTVARSYQENTTLMKEMAPLLPPPMSPADELLNQELVGTMHDNDPCMFKATRRPIVCKNPDEIAAFRDMSWCPDPAIYAPLRTMSDEDKETLRLACYDPSQNAKLSFADVNPNYQQNEDIWGILADYKTVRSHYVPNMKPKQRVKDDCLMA